MGDAVRAGSLQRRRCRGRSRRRRRHQSRRVPAWQPSEGRPQALPRRRHHQRLLPDPGRHRQPRHHGGDDRDALPRRQRPHVVGRLHDPGAAVAQPRCRRGLRGLVLRGDRIRPAGRRRPHDDLGRRLRQPFRDRDRGPVDDLVPRRGRDARRLPAVLPAAESGRDADARGRDLPAADARRAHHGLLHDRGRVAPDDPGRRRRRPRRHRRLGTHRLGRADPRRAGDVHGHRQHRAGLRGRPRRQRGDRREPAGSWPKGRRAGSSTCTT